MRRPASRPSSLVPAGWLLVGALIGTAGCEPAPEPEFARPVGYDGLLEEMRTGTRAEVEDLDTGELVERNLVGFDAALDARFGSPVDPAPFTALPVQFDTDPVRVVEATDDKEAGTTTFALRKDSNGGDPVAVEAGEVLHWSDELANPHSATVASADPKASTVTVPLVPFEQRPAAFPPGFDEETGEPLPGRVVVGRPEFLERGRDLYTVHCAHCHGSAGAGDGPTAKYLHPLPRNYKPGVYKFTSTGTSGIPSRGDLKRVLERGVPGTYMPAFHPALDDAEMAAVIEYVRWLSMQGRYAKGLVDEASFTYGKEVIEERLAGEEGLTREDLVAELVDYWQNDVTGQLGFVATLIGESWSQAETEPPVTPDEPRPELTGNELAASVLRGRDLYLQKETQCATCHGTRGEGNGPQTVSVLIDAATGQPYEEPGIHDVWGEVVRPRDLTRGIYRGGRRPIDLYRRVHSGIVGSNMPGFGDNLSDEQIWDLVNFLLALPHDPDLLKDAPSQAPDAAADAVAAR